MLPSRRCKEQSSMYIGLVHVTLIASAISAVQGKYRFFQARNFTNAEAIVSCTSLTAKRLFNPERRIDVLYVVPATYLEDAISKVCVENAPTLVVDRATLVKNERIQGYIVIEHGKFINSRRIFLYGKKNLRTLQYLFVTRNVREEVHLFAKDLLNAGYRDVAFLMFDDTATGTIIRASATEDEITSRSVGSCTSVTNDVDRIPAFAVDSRRFCPLGGCTMKYAIVTDATVSFWRREDTLKLKREQTVFASLDTHTRDSVWRVQWNVDFYLGTGERERCRSNYHAAWIFLKRLRGK